MTDGNERSPKITAVLEDGAELIWYPGKEITATVETIESFLGPADHYIEAP